MATIISLYVNGRCVGRCDAKCHEAKGDDCHCICGGAFHGVGGRIAMEDRGTITDAELEDLAERMLGHKHFIIGRKAEQELLFEL
jgi:hypothetical protein